MNAMQETDFEMSDALRMLESTPATLKAWLGGLPEDWTASAGDEGDWRPFDIVGHLIHADQTDWIPRAKVILAQGEDRNFPPFDRYGQFEKTKGKTLAELLEEFAVIRKECIDELNSWDLTRDQLELKGVHPEFGEVTLGQLLSTWVVHDLTHIRQIAMSIAKQYELAVGPWKAYLSILN